MANKEARLEFDAKEARDLVKDVAKEAADQVKKAEEEMRKAQDELNKANTSTEAAREPQEKAAEELKAARDKLDDLIAKEEKKKSDPLEAVKDAIAKVDQTHQGRDQGPRKDRGDQGHADREDAGPVQGAEGNRQEDRRGEEQPAARQAGGQGLR